jgi:hypothetical protein
MQHTSNPRRSAELGSRNAYFASRRAGKKMIAVPIAADIHTRLKTISVAMGQSIESLMCAAVSDFVDRHSGQ